MLITRAAIMFMNGEVVEGHTYTEITVISRKLGLSGEHFNGFTTSTGDFVWPSEAADIALVAGQVPEPVEELMPDDLWPMYVID